MKYWLMKSEPDVYSIWDLEREGRACWEGVRNYQARNYMQRDMSVGDEVLFYHSSVHPPGVAGLARVCSAPYPDHTAWDRKSKYFDSKSTRENPRWFMVDVEFVEVFNDFISLTRMKETPELEGMSVMKKGMRLSIQPVVEAHFRRVVRMGRGSKD